MYLDIIRERLRCREVGEGGWFFCKLCKHTLTKHQTSSTKLEVASTNSVATELSQLQWFQNFWIITAKDNYSDQLKMNASKQKRWCWNYESNKIWTNSHKILSLQQNQQIWTKFIDPSVANLQPIQKLCS